jgi:hypothetical protein
VPDRRSGQAGVDRRWPTTGIVFCCARAANGHAIAAPPVNRTNSRRLIRNNPLAFFAMVAGNPDPKHISTSHTERAQPGQPKRRGSYKQRQPGSDFKLSHYPGLHQLDEQLTLTGA